MRTSKTFAAALLMAATLTAPAVADTEFHDVVIPVIGAPFDTGHVAGRATTGTSGEVVIDLLEVYTPNARNLEGGTAAIEARIESEVMALNLALENSDLNVRVRLVATALWQYAEEYDEFGLSDSREIGYDLKVDPTIAALRDQHGADLVGAYVDSNSSVGFRLLSFGPEMAVHGFHVVGVRPQNELALAHEVGHNVGLDHNPENPSVPGGDPFPWARGHYEAGMFRTVMSGSSPCGSSPCPRVAHFSSPGISYQGMPTGTSMRDNARMWRHSAAAVAEFRPSVHPEECVADATTLCLRDGRFKVEVEWTDFQGTTQDARVVQGVGTSESGLFYYINSNNWEFLIKVLDACSLSNPRYWVFFAATTNVEFTVTVTDTERNETREYFNPSGHPADAVTDTSAFATCP